MHPHGGHRCEWRKTQALSMWDTWKRDEKILQFVWFLLAFWSESMLYLFVYRLEDRECHGFNALTLKLLVLFAFLYKAITWAHYNWMINDHYSLCLLLTFFRKFFKRNPLCRLKWSALCTDHKMWLHFLHSMRIITNFTFHRIEHTEWIEF